MGLHMELERVKKQTERDIKENLFMVSNKAEGQIFYHLEKHIQDNITQINGMVLEFVVIQVVQSIAANLDRALEKVLASLRNKAKFMTDNS